MRSHDVPIDFPCRARFADMAPTDLADPTLRGRRCARCDAIVQDLAAMDEGAARRVLERTEERVCVRYLYDRRGQISFGRGTALVLATRLTRTRHAALAVAALVAVTLMFEACGGARPYDACPPIATAASDAGAMNGGADAVDAGGGDAETGQGR